jgi:putative DNA primase/helicase
MSQMHTHLQAAAPVATLDPVLFEALPRDFSEEIAAMNALPNDEAKCAYDDYLANKLTPREYDQFLEALESPQVPAPPLPGDPGSRLHALSTALDAVKNGTASTADLALLAQAAKPALQLTQAWTVQMVPIRWIWPGFLARSKVHLVAGRPDAGKTTVTLQLIATASRGGTFPDDTQCESPLHCFIWSSEDDIADTLAPRLKAMRADMSRVHFIGQVRQGEASRPFDPATDMQYLYDALVRYKGHIGVLMIDPIVVIARTDSHKNAETRKDLGALVTLTEALDCATVGITHFTKGTRGQDPVERVTGSLAFAAIARIVLAVAKRRDDDGGGSAFVRAKGNIVQADADIPRGFAFHMHNTDLGQGIEASRVEWGDELTGTAADVLADCEASSDEDSKLDHAVEWLREYLAPGAAFATELYDDANAAGHSERTIKRAKNPAKVKSHKIANRWHWYIEGKGSPEAADPVSAGVEYTPSGPDDPRVVASHRSIQRTKAMFGKGAQGGHE